MNKCVPRHLVGVDYLLFPVIGVEIIPDSFPFPFEPYDIQRDFMKCLYDAINSCKIGIFESPTGTVSGDILAHSLM